jgi:ubiquitin conjugation factor E4 B
MRFLRQIYADVPEEFQDPIQCTLMRDPVKLPTSGTIVDRPTIMRHLLSDTHDPFNRAPLTADMLQPATELRARIDAWRADQLSRRRAA